ncbi:MAG: hypothetical protein LBH43_12915 [Treponema sp.]|jgi:hypothetical protein|nr:hypothetical protein [Treponema sp.]
MAEMHGISITGTSDNGIADIIVYTVVIGVVAFIGVAAFTSVAWVIVPSVQKISTLSMAIGELTTCLYSAAESVFFAVLISAIRKYIHIKKREKHAYLFKNELSMQASMIFSGFIGMSTGILWGAAGGIGIIQGILDLFDNPLYLPVFKINDTAD